MRAWSGTSLLALFLLVAPATAQAFGSFKLNWDIWEEQFASCHAELCDGNHEQWLMPILDTSEGIFCYREGDRSAWPPGSCMACGQTLNAWLMNSLWDHNTPSGEWKHLFYWGNMDKVRDPVTSARQHWLQDYRHEACPGVHGAYVTGVDHQWRHFTPSIDFKLPRMGLDPVLNNVVNGLMADMGTAWDELGRWARRMIAFSAVHEVYAGAPATASTSPYASLAAGCTALDYWDRAYSLAWQWWIYEPGYDGENSLGRDRPLMAWQAPQETGIPLRTSADFADMQDIIDETYGLFGENLTPIEPMTWGRIKSRFYEESRR